MRAAIKIGILLGMISLGTGLLPGQTTLFVATGSQINSYNAATGAYISAPLATGLSTPWQMVVNASGTIYTPLYGISNAAVVNGITGQITSGSFLSTGTPYPMGIALYGNVLYVASDSLQRISTYNATTGALINANFIANVYTPQDMVIDASGRLYVTTGNSAVSVYSASTGALLNASLVSGLSAPTGLALDGSGHLFVASVQGSTVGEYDALTGTAINSSLVSGLINPRDVAVDNSGHIYIASYNSNGGYYQVGSFDATTGAAINPSLAISGFNILSVAVYAVPEPAAWMSLGAGLSLLGFVARRRRRISRQMTCGVVPASVRDRRRWGASR